MKSKVIISLFETVRLSVSISPRNLYNSLKSIKEIRLIPYLILKKNQQSNTLFSQVCYLFSPACLRKLYCLGIVTADNSTLRIAYGFISKLLQLRQGVDSLAQW